MSISKFIIVVIFIASCNSTAKNQVYMSDKDFVEHERQYSPDKSMLILTYSVDIGAFGYGNGGKAVLKPSDMSKNLKEFDLPPKLIQVKWINNKTISAGIDIIPSIRSGEKIEISDTEVNGIKIRVSAVDFIQETSHLQIEYRETSPDGRYELVAYRYYFESDMSFIHVSVIKKGESIPKYGNFFIGDIQSDRILGGTWTKDNTLLFYTNSIDAHYVQYFFVHNKPNIRFEVVQDDGRYGSKYRWIGSK